MCCSAMTSRRSSRERRSLTPSSEPFLADSAEEMVEEDLGLAHFVAGDVRVGPGDEFGESFLAWVAHDEQEYER
jgi:hypothetical protein